jgi:hypothetical protein
MLTSTSNNIRSNLNLEIRYASINQLTEEIVLILIYYKETILLLLNFVTCTIQIELCTSHIRLPGISSITNGMYV